MQDVIIIRLPVPKACMDTQGIDKIIKAIRAFKIVTEIVNTDLEIYFRQKDLKNYDFSFINLIIEMIKECEREVIN